VFDAYYGTPRSFVESTCAKGNDVLLTIDVQGAQQLQKKMRNAVYVFLLPPSLATLKKRLLKRKTDSIAVIKKRLQQAKREIKEARHYDYVVTNDSLTKAVNKIVTIINTEKCNVDRNMEVINGLCSA